MQCEVGLGDRGASFEFAESIKRPDGSEAPGVTSPERDHALIHAHMRRSATITAVMHELGHVLGGDHTDSMGALSGHEGHGDAIDLPALESVCSKLPCGALNPEEP